MFDHDLKNLAVVPNGTPLGRAMVQYLIPWMESGTRDGACTVTIQSWVVGAAQLMLLQSYNWELIDNPDENLRASQGYEDYRFEVDARSKTAPGLRRRTQLAMKQISNHSEPAF
ncbi:hypothetical protein N7523_006466 [Penicillium sp. IBT 18751x]|nr:hypothetical protein N7523_006466 [Penicillium sp. IBT 18751x]